MVVRLFGFNFIIIALCALVFWGCDSQFNRAGKPLRTSLRSSLSALRGDGSFSVVETQSTGTTPYILITDDFDGDGILDIATANFNNATISVLLGNGDGTFQPQIDSSVGAAPSGMFGIVSTDFDNDGIKDIAVSKWGGNVGILLGNGDGTFTFVGDNVVGTGAFDIYKLISKDFNNDGFADLAVATCWNGNVVVLLGNGDGTFMPQVQYPIGGSVGLAAADVDNDGNIDLIATEIASSGIRVMLGNGDGTFQAAGALYDVGTWPETLAVADFNSDGNVDIIATNPFGTHTISVVLGNGDGTFQARVPYATSGDPKDAAIGDFNGDGILDIANPIYQGDLNVFLGNGDGTFQPALVTNINGDMHCLVKGDFDMDGILDFAATSDLTSIVTILRGNSH